MNTITKRKLSGHWQGSWTPERVADLATDLLEEHDYNVGGAARALARKVEDDDQLWAMLMRGAVEERALMAVRFARAQAKRDVHRNTEPRKSLTDAQRDQKVYETTISALDVEGRGGLLDTFQLPDGTFLRDATRDQILAAAEFYSEQAEEMGTLARWLPLIAQRLSPGEVVSDCFTEERVQELQTIAAAQQGDEA